MKKLNLKNFSGVELNVQEMDQINGQGIGSVVKSVVKWVASNVAWEVVTEQKNSYELCGPMGDYMDSCQNSGCRSII